MLILNIVLKGCGDLEPSVELENIQRELHRVRLDLGVNLTQNLFQVDPKVDFLQRVGILGRAGVNIGNFGDLINPRLHAFLQFVHKVRLSQ